MRLTTFLAVVFITLLPIRAQAENAFCLKSEEMHKSLIELGYFPFLAAVTDDGFDFQIYAGLIDFDADKPHDEAVFVMILEDGGQACVATQGPYMMINRGADL